MFLFFIRALFGAAGRSHRLYKRSTGGPRKVPWKKDDMRDCSDWPRHNGLGPTHQAPAGPGEVFASSEGMPALTGSGAMAWVPHFRPQLGLGRSMQEW